MAEYSVPRQSPVVPEGSFRAKLRDGIRSFLRSLPRESADALFKQIKGTCRRIGLPETLQRIEIGSGAHLLLDAQDGMQRIIYFLGFQEPSLTARLIQEFQPGKNIIDVGANIGYYSVLAGKMTGDGTVLACEPNPAARAYLERNIESNDLKNVRVLPCAIGAESGSAHLKLHLGALGGSRLVSEGADDADLVEVPIRALDEIVRAEGLPLDSIYFMKIDTEGAELGVLRGAAEILEASRPSLLIEVDGALLAKLGSTPEEIVTLLESHRYRLFDVGRGGTLSPCNTKALPPHTNLFAIPAERA